MAAAVSSRFFSLCYALQRYQRAVTPGIPIKCFFTSLSASDVKKNSSIAVLVEQIRRNSDKVSDPSPSKDKQVIALMNEDNTFVGLRELHDVQKSARKKNLKLVKVSEEGESVKHPVYKLQKLHQLKIETMTARPQMTEKTMYLTAKIADHDMSVKIKSLKKWLQKGAVIKVNVTGSNESASRLEEIYSTMNENLKDHGKIVQKVVRNSMMKLTIKQMKKVPKIDEKSEANDGSVDEKS